MSTYTEAVNRCLTGLEHVSPGLAAICPTCRRAHDCETVRQLDDYMLTSKAVNDPGFSPAQCDSCGSQLGGNRYAAHGFLDTEPDRGKLVHLEICEDCLFFLANGDEPGHWEP